MARDFSGTSFPGGTKDWAATSAPDLISASSKTVEPEPTKHLSSTTQPSK